MVKIFFLFIFSAFIFSGNSAVAYYTESTAPVPVNEAGTTQSPTSASQPTSIPQPSELELFVQPEGVTNPTSIDTGKPEMVSVPVSVTPTEQPRTITVPITPVSTEAPVISVSEETPAILTEEQPTSIPVTIEVTPTQQVTITSEDVTAVTVESVYVEEGQIFLRSTETVQPVTVLPHQIPTIVTETVRVSSIETIELKLRETEPTVPVYEVHTIHEERLLWLFPIDVEFVFDIDATNGEAGPVSKPWWSLFSF